MWRGTRLLASILVFGAIVCAMSLAGADWNAGAARAEMWTLSGGEGTHADGILRVVGTGTPETASYWRTGTLPLKPFSLYRVSFEARQIGEGRGLAITGPQFCNRDLSGLDAEWTDVTSYFVTPSRMQEAEAWLRFGQWENAAALEFRNVEVIPAVAVYARRGEMELGAGETVFGADYTFRAPLNTVSLNHARGLEYLNCGYNTGRFVFAGESELIYRHELLGVLQQSAMLEVDVGYHVAGEAVVQVSGDGEMWKEIGRIGAVATNYFPVPGELFPAKTLWIKFSAAPGPDHGANFQIHGYAFTAKLDRAPGDLIGDTLFFAVHKQGGGERFAIDSYDTAANTLKVSAKGDAVIPEIVWYKDGRKQECKIVNQSSRYSLINGQASSETSRTIDLGSAGSGAALLLLDSGEHQLEARTYTRPEHERMIAPPLCDDATIRAWAVPSGIKVMPGLEICAPPVEINRLSSDHVDIKPLRIDTARNEAESAQLVFRVESAQESVAIRFGELVSLNGDVLPADVLTAHWAGYVPVTIPSSQMSQITAPEAAGRPGLWPDPLLPMSEAKNLVPDTNYAIWVTAKPGKDTPAGIYGGLMSLQCGGTGSAMPIEVQVFDFTLPDKMRCETAFGFDHNLAFTYHNARTDEEQRKVLDMYLGLLSEHHISPYNPAPLDPFVVNWPDPAGLDPASINLSIDWTAWDAAVERALNEFHFNTIQLPSVGLGGGTFHSRHEPELLGFGEGTPEYEALFNAYWQAVEAHLREKGWLDEAFIYWFDEPDPKDYAFVNNGFAKLKKAAPDLRRMLTEQVEQELAGGPSLWCPVSPDFREKDAAARRAEGEQFWWYVCTWPKPPFATLFIDQAATAMRAWLWQTWQREIDGILIWQTNYWTSSAAYPDSLQNPYADPMGWVSGYSTPSGARRPWGNGDGRFVYPPRAAAERQSESFIADPPNSCIRLAMLRDGIEDYQYLAMLRELLDGPQAEKLMDAERDHMAALLEVPESISARLTEFTPTPEPIMHWRLLAAHAIEKLSAP